MEEILIGIALLCVVFLILGMGFLPYLIDKTIEGD